MVPVVMLVPEWFDLPQIFHKERLESCRGMATKYRLQKPHANIFTFSSPTARGPLLTGLQNEIFDGLQAIRAVRFWGKGYRDRLEKPLAKALR